MSLSRIGRFVVVAALFAWGTFALWYLGSISQFDLPGELRAIFAIGPLLLLVATFGLLRGFKSARYVMYAFLLFKLLETVLAIVLAPRLWLPALLSAAFAVGATVYVHLSLRARDASPPPVRRTTRECGLFAAYLVAIVLCLLAMDLIRGPQPFRNLTSPIAIK